MIKDTILVAGPVIIEDGKVLLNREIKENNIESPFFMFPGGKLKDLEETPREACIREAKEEVGIDLVILRPLETLVVQRPEKATGHMAILMHYLAKRTTDVMPVEDETVEWGWFDIHNLPKNAAPNVHAVIAAYRAEKAA